MAAVRSASMIPRYGSAAKVAICAAAFKHPVNVERAINSRNLREHLNRMRGAHMILLDVVGSGKPREKWPTDSHLGVFRVVSTGDEDAVPNETRLKTAFEEALASAGTLKTVQKNEENKMTKNTAKFPKMLVFDHNVPNELKNLQIGPLP